MSNYYSEVGWDYSGGGEIDNWDTVKSSYWNFRLTYRTLIRPEKRLSFFWENALQYDRWREVDYWYYGPEQGITYRQEAGASWAITGNTRLQLGAYFLSGLTQPENYRFSERSHEKPFGFGMNLGISQSFGKVKN